MFYLFFWLCLVIYIKNGMKNTPDLMLSYFFLDQICVEVSVDFFFFGGGVCVCGMCVCVCMKMI